MLNNKTLIIYIITKLELGGAQKICLSLFDKIEDKDFDTYLISGKSGILVQDIQNKSNISLIDNLKRELSIKSIFEEIKAFINLVKLLKELKSNYKNVIVHTHSSKAGILGRWAAFFSSINHTIHTIHGYGFHDHQNILVYYFFYFIELITSFVTTKFVCVSSFDVKKGLKLFPAFEKKCVIIRAAIDFSNYDKDFKANKFPANNSFIFGTIACFKPQKNLIDLLKAFQLAHKINPSIRLEIIGDGEQRPVIEKFIKDHHLTSSITLLGWQKDIYKFITKWHAFALTSLWEGLPCAIIEARLHKLPILSYNTGGITDVIFNNSNGLIYNQKDWQSLSLAMSEISCDKNLFYNLQHYQDDLSEFSIDSMIDHHKEMYKNLL